MIFVSGAFAQEKILSLEECLNIGLRNSKEIKISRSKLIASEEQITEIGSQMLPKLSFGADYSYINIDEPSNLDIMPTTSISIRNPFQLYSFNLKIQAPIFTGFGLSSLKNAAVLNNRAMNSEHQSTINNSALNIHTAYWNLFKAKRFTELVEQYVYLLNEKLKDTKQFLDNGLVTQNDLLKLQVEVSNAELKLIDAENGKEIARAVLNQRIGFPLNHQTEITTEFLIDTTLQFSYDELLNEALVNRDEIKSIEFMIEAGQEHVSAANSGWWPKVYAVGSYNFQNINTETLSLGNKEIRFWTIGLSLSWDLWDWNYTSSKSSQATQLVLQGKEQRELLKEQIEIEVYNNYLSLISAKQKIRISNLAVESATENYRLTEDKYNNQLVTSTELIDAQTDLMNAKQQLSISIADYNLAATKLEMSAGRKIY
jgi:outer membrane protein TolC